MNEQLIVGVARLTRILTDVEVQKFREAWNNMILDFNNPTQPPPSQPLTQADVVAVYDVHPNATTVLVTIP